MKKLIIILLTLILNSSLFAGISKFGSFYNKLTQIDSTNIVIASITQSNKLIWDMNHLVFIDTKNDSLYKLNLGDFYDVRKSDLSNQITFNNERAILLLVKTQDSNNDNKLDWKDPAYLYISDITGQKLTKVTPQNLNTVDFKFIENTNKIIFITSQDSNGDGKINSQDESKIFSFNLTDGSLIELK